MAQETGYVHKFWRCHNKEYYLMPNKIKSLYHKCIENNLKKDNLNNFISIHAFCYMDNHHHELTQYKNSSKNISNYMQRTHSDFGRIYNNLNDRSGKVAESRPKTPLIQDDEHLIQVHFYIEANPVRAKKIPVEKLKQYKYSSFRFYAFGVEDEYTKLLTIPDWYLRLGKTKLERQKKYRKLFYQYLNKQGVEPHGFLQAFIGKSDWIKIEKLRIS
ncbi:MAG: transposase, partial [Bdellovibrionales bacterium]|nr:transposase [Bdellovibrionales bacterium]